MFGLVEGGEELRLAPEAGQALWISRHLDRQDLDGDLAVEARIGGPVHLTIPPAPRAAVMR